MKKFFASVFLLTSIMMNAQQWEIVSEPYAPADLEDLFFVNENVGWTVGREALMFKTTDAGTTWIKVDPGTTKDIVQIYFLDENTGWAATGNDLFTSPGGSILKTIDGGETWTEYDYSSAFPHVAFTYCDDILFRDENTGFIIAGKSKANYILKTTDGGLTWTKKDSIVTATATRWYDIEFYDDQRGVVVGSAKDLQRYTTDGGETWIPSAVITDPFFKALTTVKWLNENELVTVGEGQEFQGVPTPVYRSTDGGATWIKKTQTPTNSFDRARSKYFKNSLEGIVLGTNAISHTFVYKTSDGGETWNHSYAPLGFSVDEVCGFGDLLYVLGGSNMMAKSTDFGDTWSVFPLKPYTSIYEIQFIGEAAYALLNNGVVLTAEDIDGQKWKYLSETGQNTSNSFVFLDENTGIVQKENRNIVKTTDGGTTWNTVLPSVNFNSRNEVAGVAFGDRTTGYALMSLNDYSEYHLYKTTDEGNSWFEIWNESGPGSLTHSDVKFFDANTGIIAQTSQWLKRTIDGGSTWEDAIVNNLPGEYTKSSIEAVEIIDENTALATGPNIFLKSTDRGSTWSYSGLGEITDSTFYTMSFNNQTGYIGTYEGTIYKTTDGGNSWTEDQTFLNSFRFYSSGFNEKGEVLFGTSDGYIIKWNDGSVDVEDDTRPASSYFLAQNYPNPFNPSTKINYGINRSDFVTLKVFDVLGKEVASLINEFKPAGEYSIQFDASNLASGVYLYQLKSGSYIQSRKFVLIK